MVQAEALPIFDAGARVLSRASREEESCCASARSQNPPKNSEATCRAQVRKQGPSLALKAPEGKAGLSPSAKANVRPRVTLVPTASCLPLCSGLLGSHVSCGSGLLHAFGYWAWYSSDYVPEARRAPSSGVTCPSSSGCLVGRRCLRMGSIGGCKATTTSWRQPSSHANLGALCQAHMRNKRKLLDPLNLSKLLQPLCSFDACNACITICKNHAWLHQTLHG